MPAPTTRHLQITLAAAPVNSYGWLPFAADGRIHPVIDQVFPLEAAREAMTLVGSGQARGKVVLRVP